MDNNDSTATDNDDVENPPKPEDNTLTHPKFQALREAIQILYIRGNQSGRIYFNKELLHQPMKQADPQTVRLLLEMSERQLEEADAEMSFVGAVKSILINQVASPPKLYDAAKLLGVSSRGLRRKLEESGTTYHNILDSGRLKMATKLIKETDAPISSIAYELGFSSASDFGRAFKKWSGQSPAAVRKSG